MVLAWQFAVSKTFVLADQCESLAREIDEAKSAEQRLAQLKEIMNQQDGMFQSSEGTKQYQQELFAVVSKYCTRNNLPIHSFPAPIKTRKNGFLVETTVIEIEGDFKPLLKLVHQLETEYQIGNIASVSYRVEELFKQQKKVLRVEIYVQFAQKEKS